MPSVLVAAALGVALLACGSEGTNLAREEKAIGEAITTYLRDSKGMRLDAMKMEVRDLHLDGNDARATVRFTSHGAPDGIEFEYHLHRDGGTWVVVGSSGGGHGQPQGMPEGHPTPAPGDPRSGAADPPAGVPGS